jgi:hypothetical protein
MKDQNSEIAIGIVKHFDFLSARMSKDVIEDKIIKPLLQQLNSSSWRIKC